MDSLDELEVNLKLMPNEPILLIDWSYVCFHRFFSTLRWYKLYTQNSELDSGTVHELPAFTTAFVKHFHATVKKVMKQFPKVPKENILLLKDAPRPTLWRTALYPEYKGTRDKVRAKNPEKAMNPAFFKLAEEAAASLGMRFISHEQLEADDLAYILCDQDKDQETKTKNFFLLTNDNDWIQIKQKHPETVLGIANLEGKNLMEREKSMEFKIIGGDNSDGILPIFKGLKIGVKRCQLLAADRALLEQEFLKHPEVKAKYELNSTLINMCNIPEELRLSFMEKVKIGS